MNDTTVAHQHEADDAHLASFANAAADTKGLQIQVQVVWVDGLATTQH
jgi:hypothetical protein